MNDVAIDINNFCIICSFSTKKNKSLKIILGSYHEYEGPSCDYCSTQWSSVIRHVPAIQTFSTTELSFILYLLHGNSDIISRLSMRIRIILNISLVNLLPINEQTLTEHMKYVHSNNTFKYEGMQCEYVPNQENDMKEDIDLTHSKNLKQKCNIRGLVTQIIKCPYRRNPNDEI